MAPRRRTADPPAHERTRGPTHRDAAAGRHRSGRAPPRRAARSSRPSPTTTPISIAAPCSRDVSPAEVAARFAGELPEEGESPEALLADWRERVAPLLTAVGSPRHFAYVNGSGAMIGIFAEALAACTNTNAGAWKLGPAADGDRAPVPALDRRASSAIPRTRAASSSRAARWPTSPPSSPRCATSPPTTRPRTACRTPRAAGRFLVYMADHEGTSRSRASADMLNLGRNAVRLVPSRRRLHHGRATRWTACWPRTGPGATSRSASSPSSGR